MSDYTRVYFEGLGIDFDVPSVAFTIGSYSIHWYGIIIAFGFALAVLYGGRMAYKWKMIPKIVPHIKTSVIPSRLIFHL